MHQYVIPECRSIAQICSFPSQGGRGPCESQRMRTAHPVCLYHVATFIQIQAIGRIRGHAGRIEHTRRGERIARSPTHHLATYEEIEIPCGQPAIRFFDANLSTGIRVSCRSADQDAGSTREGRYNTRYAVALINDATIYSGLSAPIPSVLNQVLLEPSFNVILDHRWNFSTSLIGASTTYSDTSTQVRVKETYGGLSAGDFDFLIGRK